MAGAEAGEAHAVSGRTTASALRQVCHACAWRGEGVPEDHPCPRCGRYASVGPLRPDLLILSEAEATAYAPRHPVEVCISIIGSARHGGEFPPLSACFADVLRLRFDDVDYRWLKRFDRMELDALVFGEDDAREILAFSDRWVHVADRFVVHCYAGIARSAGVALGLADVWGVRLNTRRWRGHSRLARRTIRRLARARLLSARNTERPAS